MNSKPIVMKFGGTSVEDANAFKRVSQIVTARQTSSPVVVVSAISGFTNALLQSAQLATENAVDAALENLAPLFVRHTTIAQSLLSPSEYTQFDSLLESAREELTRLVHSAETEADSPARIQDEILSWGEILSANLLAAVLRSEGLPAIYVDSRRCIVTDESFGRATPLMDRTEARTRSILEPVIAESRIPVLGGFIASATDGTTTTLGRGGSDFSAAIIGAGLEAQSIQIWTDVPGVMTADPRIVADAQPIQRLSYDEAAELAFFGAKVLHPKTILPAVVRGIPVRICDSRAPEAPGTTVYFDAEMTPRTVKAIAHKTGVHILSITSARMLGAYGFLRAIFEVFERHRTIVDVVTTSEVSVSISLDDTNALDLIVKDLEAVGEVTVESGRAIICVVGEGLRNTSGIAGRIFDTIKDINVLLISQGASSINLTFVIEEERASEAVSRLHKTFFESEPEEVLSRAIGV